MYVSIRPPVASRLEQVRAPFLALAALASLSSAAMPVGLGAQDYVSLLPPMEWRSIGPDRGGRSIAVAGHAERPFEYYFGATGGGLFKTTDGGTTWTPVTDGQVGSASVGAVATAPSDPDVVYIGMGEVQLRANVLQGDGVYRSDDAGKTWRHLGLADTHAIGRIRIHPADPDRAYVAALGHPFGPNPERGVFRTADGGKTWENVLFPRRPHRGPRLVMDPSDPDILYATLWQVYRKPWRLWSGGEGSGIFSRRRRRHVDGDHAQPGPSRRRARQDHDCRVRRGIRAGCGRTSRPSRRAVPLRRWRTDVGVRQRPPGHLAACLLLPASGGGPGRPEHALHPQLPAHALDRWGTDARKRAGTHVDHHDLWIDPTNPSA